MNKIKGSHDMKLLLIVSTVSFWFILGFSPLFAATYYVRPDGGTANQCTGTTDAAYPGSGTNQPCAWAHPYWAINSNNRTWKISGGDTLIISAGSYIIGYGAPNTDPSWCEASGAYECYLPPIPSGPDSANPTKILGKGWDSGCSNPPELWGTERVSQVLSLKDSSNVVKRVHPIDAYFLLSTKRQHRQGCILSISYQ